MIIAQCFTFHKIKHYLHKVYLLVDDSLVHVKPKKRHTAKSVSMSVKTYIYIIASNLLCHSDINAADLFPCSRLFLTAFEYYIFLG